MPPEKIFISEMLKFLSYISAFACQIMSKRAKHLNINILIKIYICNSAENLLSLYRIRPKYLSLCHDILMKIYTDGHR